MKNHDKIVTLSQQYLSKKEITTKEYLDIHNIKNREKSIKDRIFEQRLMKIITDFRKIKRINWIDLVEIYEKKYGEILPFKSTVDCLMEHAQTIPFRSEPSVFIYSPLFFLSFFLCKSGIWRKIVKNII